MLNSSLRCPSSCGLSTGRYGTCAADAIAVVLAGGPALAQEWTQTARGVLTLSGTSVRIEAIRKADGNTVFEVYDGNRDLGGLQRLEDAKRFDEDHAKREYYDVPSMGGPARQRSW